MTTTSRTVCLNRMSMMPYIKQERRDNMQTPGNAGELNYQITMLCNDYLREKGLNYSHVNDVVGALEGAKLEFYRRVAAPYEDTKIIENGDVY